MLSLFQILTFVFLLLFSFPLGRSIAPPYIVHSPKLMEREVIDLLSSSDQVILNSTDDFCLW